MQYIIYYLLSLFATTVGSLTGMGGGVIIKPLMDVLGNYDIQTIGVVSSITVFSMAIVSVGKQIKAKTQIPFKIAVSLAIGSIIGGVMGDKVLNIIVTIFNADSFVVIIQNCVLAILILCVFFFMKNKNKIKCKHLNGIPVSCFAGIFLGCCSSFLGIGGGPINVAIIIYLFSYKTKTATVCSIITILFAQISKLITVSITTGFSEFDLTIAPVMIIGAISGGFIGTYLNKKGKDKTIEAAFNLVLILVLCITVYNITNNFFA